MRPEGHFGVPHAHVVSPDSADRKRAAVFLRCDLFVFFIFARSVASNTAVSISAAWLSGTQRPSPSGYSPR
jgi:hypothetical protein